MYILLKAYQQLLRIWKHFDRSCNVNCGCSSVKNTPSKFNHISKIDAQKT